MKVNVLFAVALAGAVLVFGMVVLMGSILWGETPSAWSVCALIFTPCGVLMARFSLQEINRIKGGDLNVTKNGRVKRSDSSRF